MYIVLEDSIVVVFIPSSIIFLLVSLVGVVPCPTHNNIIRSSQRLSLFAVKKRRKQKKTKQEIDAAAFIGKERLELAYIQWYTMKQVRERINTEPHQLLRMHFNI